MTRARRPQSAGRPSIWQRAPILRFVLIFGVLAVAFLIWFNVWFSQGPTFDWIVNWNARAAAAIIRATGLSAEASGGSILSPRFSVSIKQGCDALEPIVLYAAGVLAAPFALRRRIIGLLAGSSLLLLMNMVRIVSLFYTGLHYPRLFETMHMVVWQALFIFLAVVLWIRWALWATRPAPTTIHAAE